MRRFHGMFALAGVLLCAAFAIACAGGSGKTTNAASETPAEPPAPAAAANDTAQPPAAPAPADANYDPATAAGAVKGVPAPTNDGSIEAVANFYTELPGFDLASLSKAKREKLLHRVNSEMCTCGCKNDTLARCLVNDPKCPSVKGLVQAAYDEVKSGS